MWLKKLRRLIRLFFFQLTGKKGDKVAKLTKPIIAVNIDGTVRVLNQDPNATHFNWYTRELLSYNITSPSYDVVVAGTNESKIALPNSSYTNRVYITENYRDIRKFTSFKLYEAGETSGPSAVDVTELYVTKISDFEYSISIPNVEHDYIITWGVGAITYTITSSLTNCVADKSDESYVGGTAVNIVITAATGYTFDSSLGGTIGLSVGEVDKTSEYMARSSDNKKVTIAIPATAAVGNIIYAAGAVEEIVQLATPTIAMNTDGKTLEITAVQNARIYDVYIDGTSKFETTLTIYDLSTLPNISDGAHTIKVKAKAIGYRDSEFSNEVNYTKAPAGYKVTFASDFSSIAYAGGELSDVTLMANTGVSTPLTSAASGLVWQGVSTLTSSRTVALGISYTDASGANESFNDSLTLTSDITITYANDTCLTGDTLITLADGTTKRIDAITLADRVLAYNPETMTLEADEIIRCDSDKIKTHSEYDVWTFDDGTIIKTVHRHRFYNVERNAMVYMDEWKIGEHGRRKDGVLVTLVSHENVKETVNHYTIFTKNQNYFANGLLSGNRYTKRLFIEG